MKITLFLLLTLFVVKSANAQFENAPFSVALDNTEFQFDGSFWEVQSEIFTTGDSALQSFTGGSYSNLSGLVTGDKTITFDFRFEANTPILLTDELTFIAYSTSGRKLVDETLATNTTSGFVTKSYYLPPTTSQVQWLVSNTVVDTSAWVDNVRIVDGDQTSDDTVDFEGPFAGNALSEAVDNTYYNFFTGSPGFLPQSTVSNFDGDAAQSSSISNNQKADMGFEINGPVDVSFDWKVSSQAEGDFLRVTVFDNNFSPTSMTQRISGEKDWDRVTIAIPDGIYFLIWDYTKNGSVSEGDDRGWIDRVVINEGDSEGSIQISPIITLLLEQE